MYDCFEILFNCEVVIYNSHFIGKKSNNPLNAKYVPSLLCFNKTEVNKNGKLERHERSVNREYKKTVLQYEGEDELSEVELIVIENEKVLVKGAKTYKISPILLNFVFNNKFSSIFSKITDNQ